MHAIIRDVRIEIVGPERLPKGQWEPLLDELGARPSAGTPAEKRHAIFPDQSGEMRAYIYRTTDMADEEIVRILAKYGIPATVASKSAVSARGGAEKL
jgi:hypothetical protein